jgi:hypothetical protein
MKGNRVARGQIDETKIARLMAIREANINAEVESGKLDGMYIPGVTPPKPKPVRLPERPLYNELTYAEQLEVSRRCKVKARECWERGDYYGKSLWGGW